VGLEGEVGRWETAAGEGNPGQEVDTEVTRTLRRDRLADGWQTRLMTSCFPQMTQWLAQTMNGKLCVVGSRQSCPPGCLASLPCHLLSFLPQDSINYQHPCSVSHYISSPGLSPMLPWSPLHCEGGQNPEPPKITSK
jgi:hypothetical protein